VIAARPLAGRQAELRALLDAITGPSPVSAGALVTGEAGIGKSRLVAEAAAAAPVPFVVGCCLRTSSDLPFLALIDIVRGLNRLHDGHDLSAAMDRCPAFVRDELAVLLPDLGSAPAGNSMPPAGWRRHRLFDSVRRTLEAFAQVMPIVVVIEDMHWADSSTVEICDYLLASGLRTPVPMVLTCRAEETDPATLEAIMTRSSLARIDLAPLTRSQTRDQLVTLLGEEISERQVDEVYRRAGGNAFFTEQLASAGLDRPGAPLPIELRAVLLGRIREAEPDERTLLAVLATSERAVTEVELDRVCGWAEHRVREGLRGLVERRLINIDRSGYTLRHALLGEAVSARLLAGERAELQGALGDLLADRGDPSLAAAAANHFSGAQRPTDELRWRVRAATHAEAVLAPIEAHAHWQRVIALWDVVGRPTEVTELQLSEVHLQAANAADLAGRRVEAQQLARLALASCSSSASILHRARIFRALGDLDFPFALDRATAALREAIRLYETLPPHREHAWALQQLVLTLLRQEEWAYPELEALLRRTLEIADRCDAPGVALKTRAILAYLTAADGDPRSALAQIEAMLTLEPDPGDPQERRALSGGPPRC
jgi:tetratricopeptide (TPR) repeat protein